MKKIYVFLCLILALTVLTAVPAAACWASPEPFEIFSGDGSRVFVFDPGYDFERSHANAAVYEIINGERQLIYAVENLASFAYKDSFYFSTDMLHFAYVFPAPDRPVFEVFSDGIKTKTVYRNDFIMDYKSIKAESSIGPVYTINWNIEKDMAQNEIIMIHTDENSIFLFNLATADFISAEDTRVGTILSDRPAGDEILEDAPDQSSESPASLAGIFTVSGSAAVIISLGVFLIVRSKKIP